MVSKEDRTEPSSQSSADSGPFRYLPLTAGVAASLPLICFFFFSTPDRLVATFAIGNIKLDSQLARVSWNRLHAMHSECMYKWDSY